MCKSMDGLCVFEALFISVVQSKDYLDWEVDFFFSMIQSAWEAHFP